MGLLSPLNAGLPSPSYNVVSHKGENQMLKILALFASMLNPTAAVGPFEPCVWPRTCKAPVVEVVQFKPCVWPNTCGRSA